MILGAVQICENVTLICTFVGFDQKRNIFRHTQKNTYKRKTTFFLNVVAKHLQAYYMSSCSSQTSPHKLLTLPGIKTLSHSTSFTQWSRDTSNHHQRLHSVAIVDLCHFHVHFRVVDVHVRTVRPAKPFPCAPIALERDSMRCSSVRTKWSCPLVLYSDKYTDCWFDS